MLQPIQTALPGLVPARAPGGAETPAAVPGAAAGDTVRNDRPPDRGREAAALAEEARRLIDDPARPLGPPPAFEANLLEAERARLREAGPAPAEAPPGSEAEAPYHETASGAAPSRLDLSR